MRTNLTRFFIIGQIVGIHARLPSFIAALISDAPAAVSLVPEAHGLSNQTYLEPSVPDLVIRYNVFVRVLH